MKIMYVWRKDKCLFHLLFWCTVSTNCDFKDICMVLRSGICFYQLIYKNACVCKPSVSSVLGDNQKRTYACVVVLFPAILTCAAW